MLHLSCFLCTAHKGLAESAALPSVRDRHEWKHVQRKMPFGWTAKLQRPVILLDFHWSLPSYIFLFLLYINYSRTQLRGCCSPSWIFRLPVWNVGHPAVNREESIPHVKWKHGEIWNISAVFTCDLNDLIKQHNYLVFCSPGQAELSILLSTKHIAQHKAHDKLIDPSETSNYHLHITRYTFGVICSQQYPFDYSHLCFLEANVICLLIRRGIWNLKCVYSISSSSKWPYTLADIWKVFIIRGFCLAFEQYIYGCNKFIHPPPSNNAPSNLKIFFFMRQTKSKEPLVIIWVQMFTLEHFFKIF